MKPTKPTNKSTGGYVSNLLSAVLSIAISLISIEKATAQCTYGVIWVVCHDADSQNFIICCPALGSTCDGTQGQAPTLITITTTEGRALSCGGGDSAPRIGDPFSGTCAWTQSGTSCGGGTWGPVPADGPYTLRPCEGTCGG